MQRLIKNQQIIMRKIILGLMMLNALVFTSCTNNEDDNNPDESIVGTWKLTGWNITQGFDLNQDGTISNNILEEIDCLNNETLVFNADGSLISNNTSYLDIQILLITGTTDEYIFDIDCGEDIDSYALSYTQNGNTIIVNDDGEIMIGVISGNKLIFTIEDGVPVYADDINEEVVSTQELKIVYSKL